MSASFKDNTLDFNNNATTCEFKGDSIIIEYHISGQAFHLRCRNNVAIDIKCLPFSYDDIDGTVTFSRYFVDENTFCIKVVEDYMCTYQTSTNYWKTENCEEVSIIELKILNNNQCIYNQNDQGHMTSNYGNAYTGIIQENISIEGHGSGTWEYGVKDKTINQGNNPADFMLFPTIPMRKQK